MYKHKFLLLAFLLLSAVSVQGQTRKIVGKIKQNKDSALPNATVTLRSFRDSILVNGTATNEQGGFVLENINSGKYNLSVSHMGFEPYIMPLTISNKDTILNDIVLAKNTSVQLDVIDINAQRPLLTRSIDKLTLNVEGSVYEKGENGLRLFNVIPGVQVVGRDIKFRGSENVTVYIDNRRLLLPSDQLSAYLRSIPSESIKSYELKAVPGAENDAQHGGVIINIVLKSEYRFGLSGNVSAGYWRNDNNNGFGSTSLNYRIGKLTAQGGFNYRNNANYYEDEVQQEFNSTGIYNSQNERYKEKYHSINFNLGFDYKLSESQTLGANFNMLRNPGDFSNNIITTTDFLTNKTADIDSTWYSRKTTVFRYTSQMANAFYRNKLDTLGSKLDIGYSLIGYDLNDPATIETSFFSNENTESRPRDSLFAHNNGKSTAHVINLDLEKHFSKSLVVSLGGKYTTSKTDYSMVYRNGLDDNSPLDTIRSNRFLYNEKVLAFYGTITKSFKNWEVKAGLRTERTDYDGQSITTSQTIARDRWDFFPSAFVNRKFGKEHSLTFSYSRRIDRPGFRQLNPFTFYSSINNLWQGNPNLMPYYSNNIQAEYLLKNKYTMTIGYQNTNDGIARRVENNGEIIITQEDNISDYSNLFISFNLPITITKWWEINVNATLRNTSIDVQTSPPVNRSKFSQYFWASNKFNLPNKYFIEISGNYSRNEFSDIFDARNVGKLDITMKKSFFDDKLTTSLELMDPFHFYKMGQTINNQNFTRTFVRTKLDWARYVGFNITYSFSSGKKSTNRESIDAGGNEVRRRL